MTTYTNTRSITILEGPDGGGKSTMAKTLAHNNGARLVHLGPFKDVSEQGLARLYVEAMLPALLGYQDVILDRSWISEAIYGEVFREGEDRIGIVCQRMLERIAMRCFTRVFLCLPPVESCVKTFRSRRGEEMLEREEQLVKVYQGYACRHEEGTLTCLPTDIVDYTDGRTRLISPTYQAHPLGSQTAGNIEAPTVLIGEAFAEVKDTDPLFQAPFVSFSGTGCSRWVTQQLEDNGINERDLLWANANDPHLEQVIASHPRLKVIALGSQAMASIDAIASSLAEVLPSDCEVHQVAHPQHAKRFNYHETYELVNHLCKET